MRDSEDKSCFLSSTKSENKGGSADDYDEGQIFTHQLLKVPTKMMKADDEGVKKGKEVSFVASSAKQQKMVAHWADNAILRRSSIV